MPSSHLDRIAESIAGRYAGDRRLLTFDELVCQFTVDPYLLARNAEQYLRDAIEHFGTYDVRSIGGPTTRWRLFDGNPDEGMPALIGQEAAQRAVVETISAAAREGRLDRMIVLHGPNGSGKSSLVELLQWGLESYSHQQEGALYALRWIFPKTPAEGAGLGFAPSHAKGEPNTYALLDPDDVGARIVCELRCNPLFVVPDSERPGLLAAALEAVPARRAESFRHYLTGNLCPRCKQVYEALLAAYHGDWHRLCRHVQVERVFVSRRYRRGAVVTQPQGTADAHLQLVSGNAALAGLPPFLLSQPLFEVMGDLADANRGILEFSDFLKRNLELSKYLLQTTEKGFVTVNHLLVELDLVFLASANDRHLEAFKQLPEFASFQARMAFVRVPYLRETRKEVEVYRVICREMARSRHVAPHLAETCALFAVLTRMHKPKPDHYPEPVRAIVRTLTPLEKTLLYSEERIPDRLDATQARELRSAVVALRDEHAWQPYYEGRVGASVREMRSALIQAAVRDEAPCVSPSALLAELAEMISDPSLYRFLQVEPDDGYHDAAKLLEATTAQLGRWILHDVQDAMQLVSEDEYDRRFDEYFQHVVAHTRGATVRDPNTGDRRSPDLRLLESVERLLPIQGDVEKYRRDLVSRIGAYAVDNPAEKQIDFRKLFPDLLRALRRHFFEERRSVVERVQRQLLLHGTAGFADVPEAERKLTTRTMENLTGPARGYCPHCAKDAVQIALDEIRRAESH